MGFKWLRKIRKVVHQVAKVAVPIVFPAVGGLAVGAVEMVEGKLAEKKAKKKRKKQLRLMGQTAEPSQGGLTATPPVAVSASPDIGRYPTSQGQTASGGYPMLYGETPAFSGGGASQDPPPDASPQSNGIMIPLLIGGAVLGVVMLSGRKP